jgi:hypothetical protein
MPTKMVPIAECEIKPRGGLSQACGKALLHQRQQAAGACDVSVIAHGRADRTAVHSPEQDSSAAIQWLLTD